MNFTLIKTKRKSVTLEISNDGTLIVRAPLNYTEAEAQDFVKRYEKWVLKHLPSILNKKQEVSLLSEGDIKLAKKGTELLCTYLVKKYSSVMNVEPVSIKITSAKKRFGSCSGKNGICFSYFLMLYPIEAITYVVVHELAHIKHHNHSKSFHQYVKKYLPQADRYESMLQPEYAKHENLYQNLKRCDDFLKKV